MRDQTGVAGISYFVLHAFAKPGPAPTGQSGQLAPFVIGTMLSAAARIGQYLVPIICLAGAAISAWKRRERMALLEDATHSYAKQRVARPTGRG